jgi:hypothetical protein
MGTVRGNYVLGLAVLAACGRWGFDAPGTDAQPGGGDDDAAFDDSLGAQDADVDGTPGPGYTVVTGTSTYPGLPGAVTVPGFAITADDESYAMTLPFAFTLYGTSYSTININVNGFVTFGPSPTGLDAYVNDCPLDATTPAATIAVFWDDLFSNTITPPSGSLTYAQDLAAGDPWFAVEWRDLDAYFQAGGGNNHFEQNMRVTQQLVLHASGVIEMKYGPRTAPTLDRDCGLQRHRGCSATIGIEAAGDSPTRTVQCGNDLNALSAGFMLIDANRTLTFTPI